MPQKRMGCVAQRFLFKDINSGENPSLGALFLQCSGLNQTGARSVHQQSSRAHCSQIFCGDDPFRFRFQPDVQTDDIACREKFLPACTHLRTVGNSAGAPAFRGPPLHLHADGYGVTGNRPRPSRCGRSRRGPECGRAVCARPPFANCLYGPRPPVRGSGGNSPAAVQASVRLRHRRACPHACWSKAGHHGDCRHPHPHADRHCHMRIDTALRNQFQFGQTLEKIGSNPFGRRGRQWGPDRNGLPDSWRTARFQVPPVPA